MPEKLSVLVVEDEQIIALDLAAAVEEAGCNVVGPVGTVPGVFGAVHAVFCCAGLANVPVGALH